MRWLIADWSGNKDHVFSAVDASLAALGHDITTISRSDGERRGELLDAIKSGSYDVLLTWQRFYHMQTDILGAIEESGIRTVFMDYGFMPHYDSVVFDSAGENAASSWLSLWKEGGPTDLSPDDLDAADTLMQTEVARARLINPALQADFDPLRMPFVFIPFQRPSDAVIRFDSSVHDFGQLFRRVLFLARGHFFVVAKTHPLDSEIDLGVPDRVDTSHFVIRQGFGHDNEQICDYLLSRAALVVGINSNMLFRALLFGTPVMAAGRGWYTGSRAIHEVDGVGGLRSLSVSAPKLEAQRRYVATCLTRQLRFDQLSNPEEVLKLLNRLGILSGMERVCA